MRHLPPMPLSQTLHTVRWCVVLIVHQPCISYVAQALIAKNQLSWDVVMRPEQVVNVGDVVKARVSHIDQKNARVNLSLKLMTVRFEVVLFMVQYRKRTSPCPSTS